MWRSFQIRAAMAPGLRIRNPFRTGFGNVEPVEGLTGDGEIDGSGPGRVVDFGLTVAALEAGGIRPARYRRLRAFRGLVLCRSRCNQRRGRCGESRPVPEPMSAMRESEVRAASPASNWATAGG